MKNISKIDKFYIVLVAVFIMLSVVVIFTLRTIFDGLNKANSLDPASLSGNVVRIDKVKLDAAVKSVEDRQHVPLDLR